jgi:hypothetical protein
MTTRPRPVLIAGAIASLLNLGVLALPYFGVDLPLPLQGAIVLTVWSVVALFTQGQVTPISDPQLMMGQSVTGVTPQGEKVEAEVVATGEPASGETT